MTENPLGYEKISKLLKNFAVPSIVASLVGSIYNIVDQIFIGQGVGYLGNAATNVAYPFSTICLAIALLVGIGSASRVSLCLGRKEPKAAAKAAGNGIVLMGIFGIIYLFIGWRNFSAFAPKGIWGNDRCISICKAVCQHNIDWNAVSYCNEWYEQFDSSRWKTKVFNGLHGYGSYYQYHS